MRYQQVTVGGLLVKDGKVLIVRRSGEESYFAGYYELPGGKVEFGDHPEKTVEKEFMEEVNLKVNALYPYRIFTYVSGERHAVEIVYMVEAKDVENIRLSDEHDDHRWIRPVDVDKYKMTEEIKKNIEEGLGNHT